MVQNGTKLRVRFGRGWSEYSALSYLWVADEGARPRAPKHHRAPGCRWPAARIIESTPGPIESQGRG